MRRLRWRWLAAAGAAAVAACMVAALAMDDGVRPAAPAAAPIALAVMGDSNSHAYQDTVSFPVGSGLRGGAWRDSTFQWTEILARLRGHEIDLGPWETSGRSGFWLNLRYLLGQPEVRAPRKLDHRYNFANSGAPCDGLTTGRYRQAPRLVAMMDREPERWRRGVVVIRIGMASLSSVALLDGMARDPADAAAREAMDGCLRHIGDAVRLIRASHPATHIVLVNVFEDANDPVDFAHWLSPEAVNNIGRAFDHYRDAVRALAARDPAMSFFDDRAWFRAHWGQRGTRGEPAAFRTVAIGAHLRVRHALGDPPTNTMVADGHAGLVWNALWAQALVRHLREPAGLPLTPIGDEEVARFVEGLVGAPLRAPGS